MNVERRGPSIAVLCGGFGAARFVPSLTGVAGQVSCIVNTADDLDHLGVHISPDIDSVCYGLAGRFDEHRGWGLVGDTFCCVEALERYGDGWFKIGDEDLALSLRRTAQLHHGASLSDTTMRLVEDLGLDACVLPMSDAPVRTVLHTDAGVLSFQDYLVRRRAEPLVRAVHYLGLDSALPAPGVLDALERADVVLIAPSSPVASIGPILALPGVLDTLQHRHGPTVAVTPVVTGQPPGTGPEQVRAGVRRALMASRALPHRATAVAALYRAFLDGFILDERDAGERDDIEALGQGVLVADTLAGPADRLRLASEVVGFATTLASAATRSEPPPRCTDPNLRHSRSATSPWR